MKAKACDAELISKDAETLFAKVLILCFSLNLLSLEAQVETEETRNSLRSQVSSRSQWLQLSLCIFPLDSSFTCPSQQ